MPARIKQKAFKWFLVLIYVFSFITLIYIFIQNLDYYLAENTDRILMPEHNMMKPSGLIGHGLGNLGTAMMIVLLIYSARKRFRFMNNLGNLSHWLDIHIFFGIIGPLLITLHTAFKFNGIVSVSFWSMVAVALSGFVGRYLYVQIPRNIAGHQLSIKDMENMNLDFNKQLRENYNLTEEMIKEIDSAAHISKRKSEKTVAAVLSLIQNELTGNIKLRHIKNEYVQHFHFPASQVRLMMRLARKKARLERRIQTLASVQNLFHYWHIFHKPFAIIMYIIMIVHITVAVLFGYTWIF